MEQQKDEKIIFCKGGGCTAKLGAGILSRVLERLYDRRIIRDTVNCRIILAIVADQQILIRRSFRQTL